MLAAFGISIRRFLHDTRAGATAITAAAITVMTLGGAALITDHLWLVGQRDTLKSATDSAAVATTIAMRRLLESDHTLSNDALKTRLEPVARRYIELNLTHLRAERLARAKETLTIELAIDRAASRVKVVAKADLGGTLFARVMPLLGGYAGPDTMQADTTVECAANAIEVVLALDVTASMHASIDSSNRRLDAVIKAAKALVEELRSGCDESAVAMGIVPWDKTVRVPNAATWRQNTWVKIGPNRTGSIPTDWAGCVEDRAHDANPLDATALESATSMSLDLPVTATNSFPVFIYPDTTGFSVTPMENSIKAAFPNLADGIKDALKTELEALRDNDWGSTGPKGRGGGNYNCTATKMLPLTTTLTTVDTALDGIKTSEVMGGGTMAHLGVTWGRRMLAHTWREVWGDADSVHPINPVDRDVTKALILLTDGGNALEDDHSGLPGRLDAKHVGVPDCLDTVEDPPKSCRQGALGTYYSALGRLGPAPGKENDKAQGYYYSGWGLKGTTGGGEQNDRDGARRAHEALLHPRASGRADGLHDRRDAERQNSVEGRPRRVLGRARDRRRRPRRILLRSHGPRVARPCVPVDRPACHAGSSRQLVWKDWRSLGAPFSCFRVSPEVPEFLIHSIIY